MASLSPPPRKNPTPTRLVKQPLTPLQTLLHMGFSKHRAEKGLAATGNHSAQAATNWLLAHINDPQLDENEPREYVLYACPSGQFLEQLQTFWNDSKELCGWNGAHNCLPHITLVSFFKAPDECESEISKTLKRIVDHTNAYMEKPLEVELFQNNTFMGLCVKENDANFLKRIALQYVKEVSPLIISDAYEQLDALVACFPWCGGVTSNTRCIPRSSRSISLEPHVQSLHLTLAYKFNENHFEAINALLQRLDLTSATTWELRLYSRDARVTSKQTYQTTQSYQAHGPDELELNVGDYICVSEEALENSKDGWVDGFSASSGCSGLFPFNYVVRVPESETWCLHRRIQICGTKSNEQSAEENVRNSTVAPTKQVELTSISLQNIKNLAEDSTRGAIDSSKKVVPWDPSVGKLVQPANNNQKLLIMRHSERVDFAFPKWMNYCFDSNGVYRRLDLNMPKTLPFRKSGIEAWRHDSPITNIGIQQAVLVGDMLKDVELNIEFVYSSPAYRCLQTTRAVLEGMNCHQQVQIRIEPALFEWCKWYPENVPHFLTPSEVAAAGFNIDLGYVPLVTYEELEQRYKKEGIDEFYARNHLVTEHVTKLTSKNILLVGHAANLDTNSRLLLGGQSLALSEVCKLMTNVSYASLLTVEKNDDQWQIANSNVYPISHSRNFHFDWRPFQEQYEAQ